jgi:cell division transport system ATP-binding protein
VITYENVFKSYDAGSVNALSNVSVEIDKGEFVFLVGPSGSGKSTFLHLALREEKQNAGAIHIAGQDVSKIPNRHVPQYRRKIGTVFQGFRLLNNKTVHENVSFALQVIGKGRHAIETLVPRALEVVGLTDKKDRMPHELSGGEQQRVAIARAFVNNPLIILADEPTGNLDPVTSIEIMKVFESINKSGTTILMATHNEDIVNQAHHRVLEFAKGNLIRDEKNGSYKVTIATDEAKTPDDFRVPPQPAERSE